MTAEMAATLQTPRVFRHGRPGTAGNPTVFRFLPDPSGRLGVMEQVNFDNPAWRIVRRFWWLAAAGAAVGTPAALGAWHLSGPATRDGGPATACLAVAALGLPLTAAMVLCGLLTIPNAVRTGQHLEAFGRHECLADWTYPPAEWRRYVAGEEGRLRRVGRALAALAGGLVLFVGLVAGIASPTHGRDRVVGLLVGPTVAVAVAAVAVGCSHLYVVARRRRMAAFPRAVIGRQAVLCGGTFTLWGSNMLVLRSARLVDGTPPLLELVTGMGGAGLGVARVADVVNLAGGHYSGASNATYRYTVPVPDGRLDEARAVLQTILGPAAAPPPPATVVEAAGVTATPPPPGATPPVATPRSRAWRRARRAWAAAAGLLGVGFALLVASVAPGPHPGGLWQGVGILGFVMGCAAPVAAVVATAFTALAIRARGGPTGANP